MLKFYPTRDFKNFAGKKFSAIFCFQRYVSYEQGIFYIEPKTLSRTSQWGNSYFY